MKKIITILTITLTSTLCFAQKSDTLKVGIAKYNFIKIGDKVYKITHSLEEVKPEPKMDSTGNWIRLGVTSSPTLQGTLTPYAIPNTNDGVYHLRNLDRQ